MEKQTDFEEQIKSILIENSCNIDETVYELFNSELNYNNADKTSGQTVYSKAQLYLLVQGVFDTLIHDEDHCSNCGMPHEEEKYDRVSEPIGNYKYETLIIGYHCPHCGVYSKL